MHFGLCLCVEVWDCNATDTHLSYSGRWSRIPWEDNGEEEPASLPPTFVADATSENRQKAKEFINGLTASGGNVAVYYAGPDCTSDRPLL
jgi:hypothetical protein